MSRSGIVEPDVFSYNSPNPIMVYGEAVVSSGLVVRDGVDGLGLLSRGLLWELYSIWIDIENASPITTSWSNIQGASITTSWTAASGSSISTSWTSPTYGLWGDSF